MKVLFIENAGNHNAGAFHSLIALMGLLQKSGVECYVALPDRADGIDMLDKAKIPYILMRECSYTWMLSEKASQMDVFKMPFKNVVVKKAAKKLAAFIRENNIDIVHENTSACYIGYYAAKLAKVKHIWHIREFMEEDFGARIWWKKRAYRMMSSSDAIITISKAIYNKYAKLLDESKMHMVYNGIEVAKFYDDQKQVFEEEPAKLLCAGRFGSAKGQMDLLNAMGVLKKKYNLEPVVYFAGSYEENQYTDAMAVAEEMGIKENVNFLGQVRDMKGQYHQTDIFCMCSRCEGFGRVTVEAMLAGALVVGANSGGTTEILESGEYGVLYEPGNIEDLAEKIAYVLTNKDKMTSLAALGREHANKTYDARRNAENIHKVYEGVLAEK